MAKFKKLKKSSETDKLVKQIEEDSESFDPTTIKEPNFNKIISTGSTLLDLAISGERVHGGGIPGGILIECYGVSSGGKTAIMAEVLASAQARGGQVEIKDPEGRLDRAYAKCYGLKWSQEQYDRPDTICEAFESSQKFINKHIRETSEDPIHVVGVDSVAALSTELEMEKGDKMGMRRAKDFSTTMRIICRDIANSGNTIFCTNQVRMGDNGRLVTPGGFALEFYTSLRLNVKRTPNDIVKMIHLKKKESEEKENAKEKKGKQKKEKQGDADKTTIKRVVGVRSEVTIVKSTIGIPFRSAPICIRFNYGLDDIMANIQWYKDMTLDTMFEAPDGARFQGIEQAILHVEDKNLEFKLKERVTELWYSLENQVKVQRKVKKR